MFPFSFHKTWVAKTNSYICELDAHLNSNELFLFQMTIY